MKTKKTKICVKCNETKPITEFYHTDKTIDGRSKYCKKCIDKYYQDNPELKKEYSKAHYYNKKRGNENTTRLYYTITIRDVENTILVIGKLPCGDLYFDLDNITVIVPKENIKDFSNKLVSRWNEFTEREKSNSEIKV